MSPPLAPASTWSVALDLVCVLLLVTGVAFMLLGAVGVVRLPDPIMRTQASTKTATMGIWTTYLSIALHFGDVAIVTRALAVIAFAALTVPVGGHVIARAAYRAGVPLWPRRMHDALRDVLHRRGDP